MNSKTIIAIISVIVVVILIALIIQLVLLDQNTQADPRQDLSKALAAALENGITNNQINNFSHAVSLFKNGNKAEAKIEFQKLSETLGGYNLSQITVDPPSNKPR
jgi:cell division protein YceG involved in septum cleavage